MPLWYGALVGIPMGLLGLLNLVFVVLVLRLLLLAGVSEWDRLWDPVVILLMALVPSVMFSPVDGWPTRVWRSLHAPPAPPTMR